MRFVLAGGRPEQIEAARRDAARAGVDDVVIFAGQRPAEEIPAYLDAADVLVSPRSTGTNTPLKIYQYLRSGRPIVATRLLTHTQVLDDECRDPDGADARRVSRTGSWRRSPIRCRRVRSATARAQLAETKYSYESYLARTRQACAHLTGDAARAGRRRRRVSAPRTDHYSYSVYADPAMAESFDALRFSGPIGRLIAEIAGARHRAVPRARRRAHDPRRRHRHGPRGDCPRARGRERHRRRRVGGDARVARRRAADAHVDGHVRFTATRTVWLSTNRSFDAVVCLRVLMHTPDWRQSLGELCRVARHRVVFDYPALASAAALQALTRRVAAAAGVARRGLPCVQRSGRARDAS